VTITWRVSGLKSEATPITLRAVMAGSDGAGLFVCAVRTRPLASNASVHSTRMLPKTLMIYLLVDSQLISAQNQWDSALNEVNTARFDVCGRFFVPQVTQIYLLKAYRALRVLI
jgi:hypothetical protein